MTVLTDMEFLSPGEAWPPPSEVERLERYHANRLLFDGRHELVYRDWSRFLRDDGALAIKLVLNWHRRLSTLWGDLLLGEPPRIHAGDSGSVEEQTLTRLITQNRLFSVAYATVIDASRYGVGIFKVRSDGKRAVIEPQNPSCWFPVVSVDNLHEITAHVLAWPVEATVTGLLGKQRKKYIRVEIHRKGEIENRLYELQDTWIGRQVPLTTLPEYASLPQTQRTGVDGFLIVPYTTIETSDAPYGPDDYSDLDSIIQEMECRFAQISRILDKHADPSMYGPPLTGLDGDGDTMIGGSHYIAVQPGEQTPGYLVWDGQLEAAFREIDLLMQQLYLLSETSPAAFGKLEGGIQSGTALQRLMLAPLKRAERIRQQLDPALRTTIQTAAALEAAHGLNNAVPLPNLTIEWQDGLPIDETEATTVETQRYAAGLTSLEASLRRLYGLEGEALTAEIERIKAERAVSAPDERPRITLDDVGGAGGE